MTPAQHLIYAVSLFFALSSLLKWTVRRQTPTVRMERSLRLYRTRLIEGLV